MPRFITTTTRAFEFDNVQELIEFTHEHKLIDGSDSVGGGLKLETKSDAVGDEGLGDKLYGRISYPSVHLLSMLINSGKSDDVGFFCNIDDLIAFGLGDGKKTNERSVSGRIWGINRVMNSIVGKDALRLKVVGKTRRVYLLQEFVDVIKEMFVTNEEDYCWWLESEGKKDPGFS